MIKSLSVPERLFRLATWVVSFLFAGFLIGLGGKIVGDLPGVDRALSVEQFMDPGQLAQARERRQELARLGRDRTAARERAQLRLVAAGNSYQTARSSFNAWVATRTATTDPRQDPEVLRRNREIDALLAAERTAQAEVEQLDAGVLEVEQEQAAAHRRYEEMENGARKAFDAARTRQELQVFAIRLLLTLPLLLAAAWLVLRKRRSEYWPLARGFVLFAAFAFFVELVPYLPSYGGYVRYGVGVILTGLAGVYLIRAMQRYMERRAEAERQSESERRQAIGYEEAIKRVSAGVCPGCERPIASVAGGLPANYCVHCGMTLFDDCGHCHTRKNAFFHYCPSCGVGVPSADAATPVGSAT
ncbi:MAG: putative rane protein [Gemmatimonadetes bacterium]|jgi:hypothetical protein|nr:putative rane protein [Gemmatimonadota bacterium]